ncbi:amino acid-binding ACT domain protein [Corynebacterium guangdongense]|uniref:ACT domain-containing protein n=1 Tax=Corynebacterium guangdongense TaxID=1783348 RepID=A0ABU1ZWL2_9CORY|nr:amino acid-binding ACT domain protein [Corynebacterium guangdongense]MDR7329150.1 hypothetical protein [Corynebacterium guangdongense]WJZ17719.1 ACT domain protein [Corynebacterium guangdongense]
MSFLIRVALPDTPGSLGRLAEAFGRVGANIQSVDIVEVTPGRVVVDDIVVSLSPGVMADVVITAANSVEGADVDSIRPFSGRVDRRGQIEMLAQVARHAHNVPQAMADLMLVLPTSMTASWALVLRTDGPITRVAASAAAPEDDGSTPERIDVDRARTLHPEKDLWLPESWTVLESALAAAPLKGTDMVIVVARAGGPDFLAGEIDHLHNLATIVGALLR